MMIVGRSTVYFVCTLILCLGKSTSSALEDGLRKERDLETDGNSDVDPTTWCWWVRVEWSDLFENQRLAASALGFTESTWNDGFENRNEPETWPQQTEPDCCCGGCQSFIPWDNLDEDEQSSAEILGFNEERWDNALHLECRFNDGPIAATCLSSFARVHIYGKGAAWINNVEIGDRVLVASNGISTDYEEVYSFGHKDAYGEANFLQISTSENQENPLEITGEHLIMKRNAGGEGVPVRADSIRVGDMLVGIKGDSVSVTKISSIMRPGLYSPLTKSGTIVANGVQVSSYTAMQNENAENFVVGKLELISHHLMSHAAIGPFRSMCLGRSGLVNFCGLRNEEGQLLYAAEGEKLISWIKEQEMSTQIIVLSSLYVWVMSYYVMEKLFGCLLLCGVPLLMLFCRKYALSCKRNTK